MTNNYLIVFFLFITLPLVKGQHFSFVPGPFLEESVSASALSHHSIYMENLTGGELVLGWQRLETDLPLSWQADLCDYVSCYMGIPEGGTMSAIQDTIKGYLRVTLNPNNMPGTGSVTFRVFDIKHPEIADTCTFVIHAIELTAVEEISKVDDFKVFPIPANDYIIIEGSDAKPGGMVSLYDSRGTLFIQQRTNTRSYTRINVRDLPGGVYLVQLTREQGIIERKKILVQ